MIDELLARARQRVFIQSFAENAALAVAFGFAFSALVLIAGTGLLAVWMPLAAGLLAFGVGSFRTFWLRPTQLSAARSLDRRCGLADALSTELHFRSSKLAAVEVQRAHAEAAARSIDVVQALPLKRPRALYPSIGFFALALFLFFLRFGVERRLELSAPMLAVLDPFSLASHEDGAAKARKNGGKPDAADVLSRLGTSTPDDPVEKKLSNPPGSAVDSGAPVENPNAPAAVAGGKTPDGEKNESGAGDPGSAGAPKPGADQPPSSRDGASQSPQGGTKGQGSPESSGLLSKIRDAMSGLMSKMKPQSNQPPPGGQQNSQQANGKQPGGTPQSGQKGAQDGQKSSDGQAQAGEDDSAASESEQSKSGDGKGKSDQNASAKPGSGMGHSDGSKELKDAEQLAAMGKLSEIIGKRSAAVTGEMTIESQSGPQQLRTAYARSDAKHSAASGDVARDEVPVDLQAYVQKYFEQVRKQAARKESK